MSLTVVRFSCHHDVGALFDVVTSCDMCSCSVLMANVLPHAYRITRSHHLWLPVRHATFKSTRSKAALSSIDFTGTLRSL